MLFFHQPMIEIITTLVVTASSVFLFGYWFRYTCMLILSARTARDYAASVAMANQLSFLEVQSTLRDRAVTDLDRLRDALDRDYGIMSGLLKHASQADASLETGMLVIDYRLMRAFYSVSRRISAGAACRALEEMSQIVAHFANTMGERSAAGATA